MDVDVWAFFRKCATHMLLVEYLYENRMMMHTNACAAQ